MVDLACSGGSPSSCRGEGPRPPWPPAPRPVEAHLRGRGGVARRRQRSSRLGGGEGRRARREGGRAGPRDLHLPSGRGAPLPGAQAGGGSGRLETVLGIFIIDHQLTPPGQNALTAPSGCWKSEITSLSLKSGALLASPWRRGG